MMYVRSDLFWWSFCGLRVLTAMAADLYSRHEAARSCFSELRV
jgi:hypothetical protein